jgi:hypothetical protein
MHIKSISFKSIRQLNANIQDIHVDYAKAVEHMGGLTLAKVNLLIGENGAGKSTIIDMIRALRWPDVLPSLSRDNPEYGCSPAFCIEFEDSRAYLYRFAYAPLTARVFCVVPIPLSWIVLCSGLKMARVDRTTSESLVLN